MNRFSRYKLAGTWLLRLLFFTQYTLAQTKVQVVSKTVERELTDISRLIINANKADVSVKGWNKPGISLKIRFVAKHPDRAVAEREVDYLGYDVRTKSGTGELTNRYTIPQTAGKVQSALSVSLELLVPQRCALGITSSFGDLDLSDLGGEVVVKYEFGKLTINNLTGKTTATSAYGDLDGVNTAGQLTLKTDKANVLLRGLSGNANLQCRYGKLTLRPDADLSALTVAATRTDILLLPRRLDDFRYDVRNTYADILVPDALRESLGKFVNKAVFDYEPNPRKPLLRIDNAYSPISIQTLSTVDMAGGK
ncbi:hypothetical protein [Fibrella aquatilis]|uniref:Adhesin domain-containing protein n=1 Tax=Fibrella aquatilis TaxID=2817059 RepID=A0A939G5N1_9BACT|nr:hypothetical protein [Fibrella aquatilis]MBO0932832.1 hypothetical protein [Fibrella aquatilis]